MVGLVHFCNLLSERTGLPEEEAKPTQYMHFGPKFGGLKKYSKERQKEVPTRVDFGADLTR